MLVLNLVRCGRPPATCTPHIQLYIKIIIYYGNRYDIVIVLLNF